MNSTVTVIITKPPDCLLLAGIVSGDRFHIQGLRDFSVSQNCASRSRDRFCRRLGEYCCERETLATLESPGQDKFRLQYISVSI